MTTKIKTIEDFLSGLDDYATPIPLDDLKRRLSELELSIEDVKPHVRFGQDHYQRNLLHAGPHYHALILCWRPGQRSPIHDHRGSACGVRVIQGTAVETTFGHTAEGLVYATESGTLHAGEVCGSLDSDTHQVSNLQPPGDDLVTLHVYSPPLLTMGMYSLTDSAVSDFCDPIVGFEEGDGI